MGAGENEGETRTAMWCRVAIAISTGVRMGVFTEVKLFDHVLTYRTHFRRAIESEDTILLYPVLLLSAGFPSPCYCRLCAVL